MNPVKKMSIFILCILLSCCSRNPYEKQQFALAKELNIDLEKYTNLHRFPETYFYETLIPGMSIDIVHEKIIGYQEVYACGRWSEVYYYFSKEDFVALRFIVFYDKNHNYRTIMGEDEDSKYIKVNDCMKGEKLQ